ncbi:hypothetical protein AB0D33_38185 [Streptomyces sp. NPDC048404]|uniref:hypothetical protein n=1 Tax=unclassified Streptomyces TaxID=2593676 RepID=UPI003440C87C
MSRPFRHPLASHAAGTILGHRRDGRPIYAIAGGNGDGGPAPAAPAPAAPAAPAAAVPPAPPAPPVPAAPAGEPQDVASLPAWAQQLITTTRAEAASWRTRAQGTVPQPGEPTIPTVPPVAPVAPEPQPADGDVNRLPRWAQQAVTDGQGAARTLAIQTALITAAPAAGADISRLLDSQSAMAALAAVNPTDVTAATEAIKAVLLVHPHLAVQPSGPPRGGAEFGAPPGEASPTTLAQAIAARMSGS